MSLELCRLFDPALASRKQWDLLSQVKAAIDRGEVEPVDIIIDRCFPSFIAMQNSVNLPVRQRSQDIFHVHLPQFYLGRERVNVNRYGYSDSFAADEKFIDDDEKSDKKSEIIIDEYANDLLLSPFVGRKLQPHIASPQVQFETKLPPALANLIGQFHTNCDTLTEGGKLCGLGGGGNGFTFPHPSPGGVTAQCQSECTGHLCEGWLMHLLNSWPTEVVFEFDDNKNIPGTRAFYEGVWVMPVEELGLMIESSYWGINVSPAEVVEFSYKMAVAKNKNKITTSTVESKSNNSGGKTERSLSKFLRAGCRILNSGKSLQLVAELKLAPGFGDQSAQEMLELVTDGEMFVHTQFSKFSKFFDPHVATDGNNDNSLSDPRYLTHSGKWEMVHLEKGKYAPRNVLTIELSNK